MREVLLLRARTDLEQLITEREGMIAENKQREHCSQPMAYGEAHFNDLAERIAVLANWIQEIGQNY